MNRRDRRISIRLLLEKLVGGVVAGLSVVASSKMYVLHGRYRSFQVLCAKATLSAFSFWIEVRNPVVVVVDDSIRPLL